MKAGCGTHDLGCPLGGSDQWPEAYAGDWSGNVRDQGGNS